jgi:hypothetical protein
LHHTRQVRQPEWCRQCSSVHGLHLITTEAVGRFRTAMSRTQRVKANKNNKSNAYEPFGPLFGVLRHSAGR